MTKPYAGKPKQKEYSTIRLLNLLTQLRKSVNCPPTNNLIKRILSLSPENREIFVDDIHSAIDSRLSVLERTPSTCYRLAREKGEK